jgi:hypothetical protein
MNSNGTPLNNRNICSREAGKSARTAKISAIFILISIADLEWWKETKLDLGCSCWPTHCAAPRRARTCSFGTRLTAAWYTLGRRAKVSLRWPRPTTAASWPSAPCSRAACTCSSPSVCSGCCKCPTRTPCSSPGSHSCLRRLPLVGCRSTASSRPSSASQWTIRFAFTACRSAVPCPPGWLLSSSLSSSF